MTDPIAQARSEGRAEGIRECLHIARGAITGDADGRYIHNIILGLLETPSATQPAQVSVTEAAKVLLEMPHDIRIDAFKSIDDAPASFGFWLHRFLSFVSETRT
jgi:hypothetical protein